MAEFEDDLSLPIGNLIRLLGLLPAWQAWTGNTAGTDAENAAAAAKRAYAIEIPPPARNADAYTADELAALRPYATIDLYVSKSGRNDGAYTTQRAGAYETFVDGGKLFLKLSDAVSDELQYDAARAKLAFMNRVGAVIRDLKRLQGGDELNIAQIDLLTMDRGDQTEVEAVGDYFEAVLVIHWSL